MEYGRKEAKKEAIMELLKKLRSEDSVGMEGKMKPMEKVTVMSDSPEGLKKGLSKAQQLMKEYAMDKKGMSEDEAEEYACGGIHKEDGGIMGEHKDEMEDQAMMDSVEMMEEDEEDKKKMMK